MPNDAQNVETESWVNEMIFSGMKSRLFSSKERTFHKSWAIWRRRTTLLLKATASFSLLQIKEWRCCMEDVHLLTGLWNISTVGCSVVVSAWLPTWAAVRTRWQQEQISHGQKNLILRRAPSSCLEWCVMRCWPRHFLTARLGSYLQLCSYNLAGLGQFTGKHMVLTVIASVSSTDTSYLKLR